MHLPLTLFRAIFLTLAGVGLSHGQALLTSDNSLTLASLPIVFEPNVGQAESDVRYVAHSRNLDLRLRHDEFELRLRGDKTSADVAMSFLGSREEATLTASVLRSSQTNYLLGADASRWRTHVPNFDRVTYANLYPGVDVVFYGNGQQLEHDFVVAPGADYRAIAMQVRGAKVTLEQDGLLRLHSATGDLFFTKPEIYQVVDGSRHSVSGRFVLGGNDRISFSVDAYDRSRALIIDPVLVYSTFIADLSISVAAVTTDPAGHTIITGETSSSTFPVTPGAFQTVCASCSDSNDVFVIKLAADGSGLVYSTFLGGSANDQSSSIAADANGNVVVVGFTQSTDFPLKYAIAYGYAGVGTAYGFVTSLSADGSSLNYSSLLGGGAQPMQSSTTTASALTVDGNGNAYVSGGTDSPVFPVTAGALNHGPPAYPETIVYVSKFSPTGTLSYSSLLGDVSPQHGGGGPIGIFGITTDALGNAYITGTGGTLWPTTTGAFQTQIPGAAPYAAPFIAKLAHDASSLVYSTFLGDSGTASGIAVNSNGEAIVSGMYAPSDFPTTANAFEPTVPAGSCCASYLSRFSSDGTQLAYSTFFDGDLTSPTSPVTSITGTSLDGAGNIWIAGITSDQKLQMVQPIQGIGGIGPYPSSTGFVSEFDASGTNLKFSTYFGSLLGGMWLAAPAIDSQNRVHIGGTANYQMYTSPSAYLGAVSPQPFTAYGFAATIDPTVAAPAICFDSSAYEGLWFGSVASGTSSTLPIKLTNCGTLPLSIAETTISSDVFTVPSSSNGCTSQVAVNASCNMSVTFAPPSVNQQYAGTVTLTTSNSLVAIIPVAGNSQSMGLVVQGNNSATVSQGGSAAFTLNIGGQGLSGTPALTCTQVPKNATCSLPASIQIATNAAQAFSVTIQTTAPARAAISSGNVLLSTAMLGLMLLLPFSRRQKTSRLLLSLPLAAIALLASCGGGNGSPGGGSPGTPAGTYTILVTATEPLSKQSVQLTLIVQP